MDNNYFTDPQYNVSTVTRPPYSKSSSATCANAKPSEDWTKMTDAIERRRVQNRIAQRNYRKSATEIHRKTILLTSPVRPEIEAETRPSRRLWKACSFHIPSVNQYTAAVSPTNPGQKLVDWCMCQHKLCPSFADVYVPRSICPAVRISV